MFEFLEGTGIRRWIMSSGGLPFLLTVTSSDYAPNWQRLVEG